MQTLVHWLPIVAIAMLRPFGALMIVPVFTPGTLGGSLVRNALVLMIALPVLPVHDAWPAFSPAAGGAPHYLWLALGELCVGALIGFCAAIPFWALDMAGFLIDTARGASMASVLNPLLGAQSSPFGMVFSQVFTLLFLVSGGFNTLIETIYASYVTLPPGAPLRFGPDALALLTQQWHLMYELCLRFAMPALAAILLVDMALGLVNRSAQQLNVFFLSMPIKSAFALLLLVMCARFAFRLPLAEIARLPERIARLAGMLR
ncbi:type III secretion system export apparatus subunit SctT [Burkholderia oklahomensis]|uniref:type III secretion system export apparatus subunit SctT n=1 Tax=Burkholderia oklahomensis TaxID=342113 RepID=UPI00016A8DC4|nr:type III secretion system export apparatus subunit SctT [Burkholderia oklahomensis]AJX34786.1 type III secretion apparatus protein SpaR/YscT/HrcT [Burkholderia oklahomensis C6786]AOI48878.1 type III secretion protein [Burkholderia oklahomensis C6786]KUY50520.1 type III secretion protein [Burkholderia oklahomensis C6786]MBI0362917.1 type III secretion system export apparatus subunit SctT [Burkholderia oklahomensis]SUY27020.1 type III secretion system protein SsaT [Burkholderia oklahomensis]